jgi:methanogenic corrinoid protein MtbC1
MTHNPAHPHDTSTGDDAVAARVEHLWNAVVEGDEYAATDVVLDALADGLAAETVLLDLIGAVQGRIGEEWAANRLTVVQEHATTAINDRGSVSWPRIWGGIDSDSRRCRSPPTGSAAGLPA